jgi:hypothetical protein
MREIESFGKAPSRKKLSYLVLRICHILLQIRTLRCGSGRPKNTRIRMLSWTLHHSSKIKSHKEIKVFLLLSVFA